jgi:hypothetical protein
MQVTQFKTEIEQVQREYDQMLVELESLDKVKEEKNVQM